MLLNIAVMLASVGGIVWGGILIDGGGAGFLPVTLLVVSAIYLSIIGPILLGRLKVLRPNEAYVLTLFGKYYGTLKGRGLLFCQSVRCRHKPRQHRADSGRGFSTAVSSAAGTPTQVRGKKIL